MKKKVTMKRFLNGIIIFLVIGSLAFLGFVIAAETVIGEVVAIYEWKILIEIHRPSYFLRAPSLERVYLATNDSKKYSVGDVVLATIMFSNTGHAQLNPPKVTPSKIWTLRKAAD